MEAGAVSGVLPPVRGGSTGGAPGPASNTAGFAAADGGAKPAWPAT